jgi:hypothetical protein
VEGRSPYYYETLLDYIHLNPVRAGLVRVRKKESVLDYKWSSLSSGYALSRRKRPCWLAAEDGLALFGFADSVEGRRKMVERLDRRAVEEEMEGCGTVPLAEEIDARCSHLRRGWYWGSQSFGERLLKLGERAMARPKSRAYRGGAMRQTHGLKQAEQWLADGLQAVGLTKEDLSKLKGSDPRKVALARLLWKGTIVSQEWLADALKMRSAANVSQLLSRGVDRRRQIPRALRLFLAKAKKG